MEKVKNLFVPDVVKEARAAPSSTEDEQAADKPAVERVETHPETDARDYGGAGIGKSDTGTHTTFTGEHMDPTSKHATAQHPYHEPGLDTERSGVAEPGVGRDAAVIGAGGVAGAHHGTQPGAHDSGPGTTTHTHTAADDDEHQKSKGSMFGFLHKKDQDGPYHNDGDPSHTAKEKYYGAPEERFAHEPAGAKGTTTFSTHQPADSGAIHPEPVAEGPGPGLTSGATAQPLHTGQHHTVAADPETTRMTTTAGTDRQSRFPNPIPAPGTEAVLAEQQSEDKKRGGLAGLLHRDKPNKLHKEPPE